MSTSKLKKRKKRPRDNSSDSSNDDESSSDSSRDRKRSKKAKKMKKKSKKTKKLKYHSDSSSNSDDSKKERRKKKNKKKSKKKSHEKLDRSKSSSSKALETNANEEDESVSFGPAVPDEIENKSRAMVPMTKDEWEKRQSQIRRVYDSESGRHRLVRGDGEIIEECVSRDRHRQINKQATATDGLFFQMNVTKK